MSSREEREIFLKLIKKASKESVKYGLTKSSVPDHVASGIADQRAVSYDLVKTSCEATLSSRAITPEHLVLALAQKGIGIAKIASGKQGWQCGVAVAVLGVGLYKAFGALVADVGSEGVLTSVFLYEAGSALADLYAMDETCGISSAVEEKINEEVLPIYMWFDRGIKELYGVPF
jgi:hypothetical protein